MALSGSATTNRTYYAADNFYTWYILNWTATQAIPENQSTVSWTLTCQNSKGMSTYKRTINSGSYVTINGTKYTIASGNAYGHGEVVKTGTTVVTHLDDGSKTFSVYVNVCLNYADSNSTYVSSSFTLDNIPRASAITADKNSLVVNGTNSVVFTIDRKVDTYTHTLTYSFGTASNQQIATNVGTSFGWAPATTILSAIPTTTSDICTITCTTYSGETTIGTSTVRITLSTNAVPTFGPVTLTNTTTKLDGTGYNETWLKYHSTGTISVGASSPGTTISSYRIANGNRQLGTSFPCTLSDLETSTITITAIDARGRIGTLEYTIPNWSDYVRPFVIIDNMARQSSTEQLTYVNMAMSGFGKTGYSLTLTVSFAKNALNVLTETQTISPVQNAFSTTMEFGKDSNDPPTHSIERDYSYTVTVSLKDEFEEYIINTSLKRAVPVFHFGNRPSPHFDVEGVFNVWDNDIRVWSGTTYTTLPYPMHQAKGAASSVTTITAGTSDPFVKIPLVATDAISIGSGFAIDDSGIKVLNAGIYRVSGSVYIHTVAASTSRGVYIYAGNNEVMSVYTKEDSTALYGSLAVGSKLVQLAANDILYLRARVEGANGESYDDNVGTYLLVERIM